MVDLPVVLETFPAMETAAWGTALGYKSEKLETQHFYGRRTDDESNRDVDHSFGFGKICMLLNIVVELISE